MKNVEYNVESERFDVRDEFGELFFAMDTGDAFHILDNLADEQERFFAAFGWLVVEAAHDVRDARFWTYARGLLRDAANGYGALE